MDLLIICCSFLILVICININNNIDLATAQEEFLFGHKYCGDTGSYTQDPDYRQNLDDVFYTLLDTNNGFGFFNSTSGQANAAALCRGDLEPQNCKRCVDDATRKIRQDCPVQIEAAGWYDTCFLRYSNRSMDYIDYPYGLYAWNSQNASDSIYGQWNQTVVDLLTALLPVAAGGGPLRKYASLNITLPGFWTVYGLMQCTPDLSATECKDCLDGAVRFLRPYSRSLGARVLLSSCVLRYENYSFFNSTWFPAPSPSMSPPSSPSPPPPPSNTNIGVIIGAILGVVAVIIVVAFLAYRRHEKRRNRREFQVDFSENNGHEMEDDDTGEMNSFDLSTIQVATNNFALENKLGEGGFGPVYKGKLQDEKEIAVKRLSTNSGQGITEFKTEVKLIIKLQHKNLVRLLGYCVKGSERLLIYEFMVNNSLDTFLFDANKGKELDWAMRLLLEIVSGQRNNQFFYVDQPQNLLSTAWRLWNQNKGEQLIDHRIIHTFAIDEALRWINIALLCVQDDPQDRPTMSTVVFMLEGQWSANLPAPSKPPLSFARFASVSEQSKTASDLRAN